MSTRLDGPNRSATLVGDPTAASWIRDMFTLDTVDPLWNKPRRNSKSPPVKSPARHRFAVNADASACSARATSPAASSAS